MATTFFYDDGTQSTSVSPVISVSSYNLGVPLFSVTIGSTCTSIAFSTFRDRSLRNATIASSVESIGGDAFRSCLNLTEVIFADGSACTSIGSDCFRSSSLRNLIVPAGVTNVQNGVFQDCNSLTSITLSSSTTNLGPAAFLRSAITSINIPSTVTAIGNFCFLACFSLTAINFPPTATVSLIGESAFEGCVTLPTVTIPASVTLVDTSAFRGCFEMTFFRLGQSVSNLTLGSTCFENCYSLRRFIFDNQTAITSVGTTNFVGANPMVVRYFSTPNYAALSDASKTLQLQFPAGSLFLYSNDPPCFGSGTKILALRPGSDKEEYVPIEELKPGQLVVTYKHGPQPLAFVGNGHFMTEPNDPHKMMYCMRSTEENELTEDLYLTGGHGVLVDTIHPSIAMRNLRCYQQKEKQPMLEDKYMLSVSCNREFQPDKTLHKLHQFWQLAVKGKDGDTRFGVYANGLLVETPSVNQVQKYQFSEMLTDDKKIANMQTEIITVD